MKNDNQGFYQSSFVRFLKFSVAAKLDLIFKWQSCVTSIISNPKLKTPT
jgi:hypothetical protein